MQENFKAVVGETRINPCYCVDLSGACKSSSWTREEDKAFENGLAIVPEDDSQRWQKIAEMVPGKTVDEIKLHYATLLEDLDAIETGLVPLPNYDGSPKKDNLSDVGTEEGKSGKNRKKSSSSRKKSSRLPGEHRKKGIAWTEEEHRLFLEGLAQYGKGDWRSISRLCVVSRTPTQVASHAQKYFIRLKSSPNQKKRPSVHDITDKGKAVEPSNPGPTVKTRRGRAARKKRNTSQAHECDPIDIENFVPPTIVQSSYDNVNNFVPPTSTAPSQMDIDYDMSFYGGFPDITGFP